MTDLIAAARRLAGAGGEPSFWDVSANRLLCTYCNGNENEQQYGGPDVQHDADCPWLALPRIVRALEAAQAVADFGPVTPDITCYFCDEVLYSHTEDCLWLALDNALRGESSQNAEASTSE